MGDKVLSELDTFGIVTIFQKSSTLITNMDVLCGALGLTLAQCEDIRKRVDRESASSYKYLSLVINKWIELNSDRATSERLATILRKVEFNSTADELLKSLESQTKSSTRDNATEKKTSFSQIVSQIVKKTNIERVQVHVPISTEVTKATSTTDISDQLKEVKLEDLQEGQSDSKKRTYLRGSEKELNEFLQMDPQKFNTLKTIELNDIKLRWTDFWYSVEHIKTLETIRLTDLMLLGFSLPSRRILLPNLREYTVRLDSGSTEKLRGQAKETREFRGKSNYILEGMIPFVKTKDSDEEFWTTCLNLSNIKLALVIPDDDDVIFKIDKDNLKFVVDRFYVEYEQNSTQHSVLPNFFRTFKGLKKLMLTNFRRHLAAEYVDFSSIPTSLTHFLFHDYPSSINLEDLYVVLKSLKNLEFLHICISTFDDFKLTIDIACLSPKIRYLAFSDLDITCSSPCEFENTSFMILRDTQFTPLNLPFIFKNLKKCLLHASRGSSHPVFQGLKNLLVMDTLELIVIGGLSIDTDDGGVGEMLYSCGVTPNAEIIALEKNAERRWKFVSLSEENAFENFMQVALQEFEEFREWIR